MKEFIVKPANIHSIKRRKPLYGVGLNDSDYICHIYIDGKKITCPFYDRWAAMIKRCYDKDFTSKNLTYLGCSVTEAWHKFSAFKEWMQSQDWKGKELDKDILIPGNKMYAPDRCLFVRGRINSFMSDRGASRGEWPIGVNFCKDTGKYRAKISGASGARIHLGRFDTPEQAHKAWRIEKSKIAIELALGENDKKVKEALTAISKRLMGALSPA